MGEAHQSNEVEISRSILDQKGQMISPLRSFDGLLLKTTSWSHINLTAHNGFDTVLDGHLVEFDHAKHIPVIGQRQGCHSIFLG